MASYSERPQLLDTDDSASYSFPSADVGSGTKLLLLGVTAFAGGAPFDIDTFTVGGEVPTRVAGFSSETTLISEWWTVPFSAATATINIAFTETVSFCHIAPYALYDVDSIPFDTAVNEADNTGVVLDIAAGGIGLALSAVFADPTWTGLVEDFFEPAEGLGASGASRQVVGAETGTAIFNNDDVGTIVAISFAAAVGGPVEGEANITEANDTLVATGTVAVKGTASITEGNDTLVATGTVLVQGIANIIEEDDTVEATGEGDGTIGTGDITEDDDALVATGTVLVTGSLSVTEDDDTLAATGTVQVLVPDPGSGKAKFKNEQERIAFFRRKRAREQRLLELEDAIADGKRAEERLRGLAIRYKKEGVDFEELAADWFAMNTRAAAEIEEEEAVDTLLLAM